MAKRIENIIIEDARLLFRNFSGKEGNYNAEGQRNFCIALSHDLSVRLLNEGWNVKYLNPRDEGEDPQPYLQVKVRFDNYPPKIVLVTSHGKSILDEETVNTLDYAEIANADVVISPSHWEMSSGKSGIAAYLKTLYITIAEDPFEAKYYGNLPDSAYDAIGGCGRCEECDEHCKRY